MLNIFCPKCGVNEVQVDMTLPEVQALTLEEAAERIPLCSSCNPPAPEPPSDAELQRLYKNLVECGERAREICKHDFVVVCPKCKEKQFSAFDKLFTFAYTVCLTCQPDTEDVEAMGNAIFKIAGTV